MFWIFARVPASLAETQRGTAGPEDAETIDFSDLQDYEHYSLYSVKPPISSLFPDSETRKRLKIMVGAAGLEPATLSLEG